MGMELTSAEMLKEIKDAEESGHIKDAHDYLECNSRCEDCPADPTCKTLTGEGDYAMFRDNFKRRILTLLEESNSPTNNTKYENEKGYGSK